jgi:SulP family sulfate permease
VEERPKDDRPSPRASTPPASMDEYGEHAPFQAAQPEPLLTRAVPVSSDFSRYRPRTARRDLLAGVTVAALAIPSAMAYAEVAGLSPVNGLYALLLPTVAYVALGSSRQLVIGPEGSISTLIAAAILALVAAGSPEAAELAAMLALLVAACFGLAWVLRLGWIADYFSRPVLVGYIHGVAVILVIGQLGKMVGLSILYELARFMGTSVDQIDKTYGHLLPDSLDRTRSALDAFVNNAADAAEGGARGAR